MDKNFIPSARRIAGAEGHQLRTLKRSSSFEQVDFEQVAEKRQAATQAKSDTNRAKQEWCIQEHTAQREVVDVKNNRNL